MFTVTVPTPDRTLLTLAEAKAALGVTGSESDASIATLIAQVSDMIARECCVPGDGVAIPTLRRETIEQKFRHEERSTRLILARRFIGSVSSVVEDGVTLTAADYEIDKGAGLLVRLNSNGYVVCWPEVVITATFTAGLDTVPEDLKLAAVTVLREQRSAASRDPLLRGETVEGIGRYDYFVASAPGGASGGASGAAMSISPVASAMLSGYRYYPH